MIVAELIPVDRQAGVSRDGLYERGQRFPDLEPLVERPFVAPTGTTRTGDGPFVEDLSDRTAGDRLPLERELFALDPPLGDLRDESLGTDHTLEGWPRGPLAEHKDEADHAEHGENGQEQAALTLIHAVILAADRRRSARGRLDVRSRRGDRGLGCGSRREVTSDHRAVRGPARPSPCRSCRSTRRRLRR